jgi:predicted DNA-binding transcriptional regulator
MSESSDTTILKQIEDYLAPRLKLDAYERILYYYLFRHTRLIAKSEIILSVPQLAESLNCSKNVVKKRLKSLSEKGVINITDAGWSGTKISVFLPSEIHGVLPIESDSEKINIEEVKFYSDARFRQAIFDREEGCCFYCRRKLTPENRGLDHVGDGGTSIKL